MSESDCLLTGLWRGAALRPAPRRTATPHSRPAAQPSRHGPGPGQESYQSSLVSRILLTSEVYGLSFEKPNKTLFSVNLAITTYSNDFVKQGTDYSVEYEYELDIYPTHCWPLFTLIHERFVPENQSEIAMNKYRSVQELRSSSKLFGYFLLWI